MHLAVKHAIYLHSPATLYPDRSPCFIEIAILSFIGRLYVNIPKNDAPHFASLLSHTQS